jgi:HAE1 family hydrophobic/amphiphilic exporter-1
MLVMVFVVLGIASFFRLGIDLYPKVDLPRATITTTLPGASAEEMETEVTKPIEEAVNTIQGIDELRATTVEGASIINISFVLERDVEQAVQDVRDRFCDAFRKASIRPSLKKLIRMRSLSCPSAFPDSAASAK